MRRSDLMRLMGLTAGGAAGAPLANKWYVHHGWTDAARAASLAVRQAKAAARAASAGSDSGSSSGSSTSSGESSSGGDGDPDSSSSPVHVSGFTVNGRGKVSVGFTDYTVDPPVNRYLTEGGEDGGWTIKSADYDAGTAVLAKDGQEISVSMGSGGGGTARDGAGQLAEEQAADQAEWQDGQGGAGSPIEDFANAGIGAFHDKYGRQPVSEDDCKEAAGLSDATTDSDLEAVEEWIRERAADDADYGSGASGGGSQAGLPEGVTLGGASGTEEVAGGKTRSDWFDLAQAAFKAKYGREPVEDSEVAEAETLAHVPAVFRSDAPEVGAGAASGSEPSDTAPGDEAIHARALEMVRGEGPDAEPPSFDDLTAVFNADLEGCKTPEDRLAALNEYRASLEAGRMMWDNASVSAFEALNGRKPESMSDWRVAEKLAGVPKPFLKGRAGAGADSGGGATENRRYLRLARLSNRVDAAAGCLLANIGWTDEARAAALAVRRAKAQTRVVTPPPVQRGGTVGTVPKRDTSGTTPPSIRAPSPPHEGMVVPSKDGFALMRNGVPVRLGSSKALVMLPDGRIAVKRNGRAYPVDDPMTLVGGRSTVEDVDGRRVISLAIGDMIDLETGEPKKLPDQLNATLVGLTSGLPVAVRMPFFGAGVPIPEDTGGSAGQDDGRRY